MIVFAEYEEFHGKVINERLERLICSYFKMAHRKTWHELVEFNTLLQMDTHFGGSYSSITFILNQQHKYPDFFHNQMASESV